MRVRVAALAVFLAACGGPAPTDVAGDEPPETSPTPTTTPTEPALHVVAKLPALADLVVQVAGERAEVVSLIPEGADSHTFEPRPGDARRIAAADVFFGNGLDLNDALIRLAEANLRDGAAIVRLAEEAAEPDEIVHDHVHDHDHGHTHGDDDNGHTHGDGDDGAGANPHLWMSVEFAMRYVDVITETLVALDPDGADVYRANAAAYLETLEALDKTIGAAVETIPEANRKLVTYHDSWSYFGPRYGLEVVAAVQPADFAQPSAAEIRRIIDQIRGHDIPAVFGSAVFPSDVLEVIAEETGAEYVADLSDDDLPGVTSDPEHSYVGMMVRNTRIIVEALGGDPSVLDAVDPATS